jgi:hypothetical protein
MRISRIRVAVALGATAACAATVAVTAGSATADPAQVAPYVAAGSNTIQAIDNYIAFVAGTANGKTFQSYDATDPSTTAYALTHTVIAPKGVGYERPNGSGEGVAALSAGILHTVWPTDNTVSNGVDIAGQVDIARSSSGPSTSGTDLTALTYVPLGRDALGVAVQCYDNVGPVAAATAYANSGLGTLTKAQMTSIWDYSASGVNEHAGTPTTSGAGTGGIATVNYYPYQENSGSGTYKYFYQHFFTGSVTSGTGSAYVTTPRGSAYQTEENDARTLSAPLAPNATTYNCALAPYGVSAWIAQKNNAYGSPDFTNHAFLANIDAGTPVQDATASAVAAGGLAASPGDKLAPDTNYYNGTSGASAYPGRDVFNVVETNKIAPTGASNHIDVNDPAWIAAGGTGTGASATNPLYDATLATLLTSTLKYNATLPNGELMSDVLAKYGFLAPSSGSTTGYPWAKQGSLTTANPNSLAETEQPDGSILKVNGDSGSNVYIPVKPGTPSISGVAQVGATLTAVPGTWGPAGAGTVTPTYAWSVGGTSIGTGSTLVVPASAANSAITLTVIGTPSNTKYKAGTATAVSATVAAAPVAALKELKSATPKISGTAVSGKTVKVSVGSWTAGTKFTYAWYLGSTKKGSAASFKIPAHSKGKVLTVKVTGKLAGYTTVTEASFGKVLSK